MSIPVSMIAAAGALAFAAATARAESRLAPVAPADAASTHSPYEMGACEVCHQRNDPRNPGAAVKISNELCFDCHDEFKGSALVKMERSIHPKSAAPCTGCHNPHNSRKKKLRL